MFSGIIAIVIGIGRKRGAVLGLKIPDSVWTDSLKL
jgi:hypothetical protein